MHAMTHRVSGLCLAVGVMFLSGVASAQSASALATEFFEKGKALETEGKSAEACASFRQSAELDPTVGAIAKVAGCQETEGDLAGARGAWQRASALASAQNDERIRLIDEEFRRLDKLVPRIEIAVEDPSIQRFDVWIDNVHLSNVSPGVGIPVNRGKVPIRVVIAGFEPWTAMVDVSDKPDANKIVVKGLVPAPIESEGAGRSGDPMIPIGWGLVGVGGVGLIGGTVFGVLTLDRKSTADTECDDAAQVCSAAGRDAADQGSTFGALTTVGWTVGALALAAGLYIVISGDAGVPEAEASKAPASGDKIIRLSIGAEQGLGASISGRF